MIEAPAHDPGFSGLPAGRAPRLGMVGGGQLARMTHQASIALGIDFAVLAARADESAALVVAGTVLGDERLLDDVAAFAESVDVLTFDHEQVPPPILQAIEAAGVVVRPGAAALTHAQDKAVMRAKLTALGAPCPRHRVVNDVADVVSFGDEVGWPVVLKTARGGYDGKGVWMIDGSPELDVARDGASDIGEPFKAGVPVLVEERVSYRRELSALVARSPAGQAVAYPIVESVQRDGICVEVIAPAPNLAAESAENAQQLALRLANELDVVGVLAVELFETVEGELLVNELAMRPHNTGHWSIDGAVTSQFENHIRAVLNLPLGDPSARSTWSVMVNVLGGDPDKGAAELHRGLLHCLARDPGLKVHLYGKGVRPGRKIGHVTVCGDDLAELRRRAWHAADYLGGKPT